MTWRARAHHWRRGPAQARRAGVLLLAVSLVALVSLVPAAAQRPNGAGLVIRHGDGTLLYVYVQFEDDSISGEELFYRSGLDITLAPFGGLGAGVCAINGEGCPSDDCWCRSYTTPAYFWHYYALVDGAWVEQIRGPTTRSLSDGAVEGWSWTAGEPGLPATSIDEIALLNGVDRNAPEPTATAMATEPPTATPTTTPTEAPPTATVASTATETPVPATSAATATVAEETPSAVAAIATPTSGSIATATPVVSPATPTATSAASSPPATTKPATATSAPPTATARATSVAVAINPSGTRTVVEPSSQNDATAATSYMLFGALAALVVGVGAIVIVRGRWGRA